ncbi:hypothetical protein CDAR_232881 [Caerostris darwini]|uniref:Uncharacterized protein n=1 Tax=Caerostris darwini TaxID=1538125 RepID=A0AAV4T421_9ARAC|nr:hypothetical protein CDAR_232881 [Caerostris darwini]
MSISGRTGCSESRFWIGVGVPRPLVAPLRARPGCEWGRGANSITHFAKLQNRFLSLLKQSLQLGAVCLVVRNEFCTPCDNLAKSGMEWCLTFVTLLPFSRMQNELN